MERESNPISIIVPVLNEAAVIDDLVDDLDSSNQPETIIVDGGSIDGTWAALQKLQENDRVQVITSDPGRARQMNIGASFASGQVLIFLHADTRLPDDFAQQISPVVNGEHGWGRFDVRFDDDHVLMRTVSGLMNMRSRITGIATGDQAIFVRATLFGTIGGFSEIPIMEDIDLCSRLRKTGPAMRPAEPVITSARRWRANGIVRTIFLMWGLRLAYWLGVGPDRLSYWYRHSRE